MLQELFLAYFEPVVTHFGPWKIPKSLENGPFCDQNRAQNGPFSRHLGIFGGPNRVTTGLTRAKNTCLSIPNGPALISENVFLGQM